MRRALLGMLFFCNLCHADWKAATRILDSCTPAIGFLDVKASMTDGKVLIVSNYVGSEAITFSVDDSISVYYDPGNGLKFECADYEPCITFTLFNEQINLVSVHRNQSEYVFRGCDVNILKVVNRKINE